MKKKVMILFTMFLLVVCSSCSTKPTVSRHTFFAMDTFISVTFYSETESEQYASEIEHIYLKYDAVASDYTSAENQKSVYDLNRDRSVIASNELLELVRFALVMQDETSSYFQPFIGKLSHLWKESLDTKEIPSNGSIQELLNEIKNSFLEIEDNRITIYGMANLDLGGIAKGYATQKAKEYLNSVSCSNYILNAGTSNIVLGNKLGDFFSVGLLKAFEDGYYKILNVKDISIGTSSIREQNATIDDKIYGHLINPFTGYPANYYDTLTILGEDSGRLDAYSTAVYAMDLETAISFLESKNLDWIACKNDVVCYESEGVKKSEKS